MKLQLARAQALLNQKKPKPDEAMKVLQPLVNRKDAPWPVYHYCGIAFLQKKEYGTALSFLNESIKQGADEPETWHSISLCYFNLGNHELAEQYEKTALEKRDNFFKGWLHLGSIYRAEARLDEALKCYQKANQLDPKSASVAYRIAEIYNDQGDMNKALELYEITVKVDSKYYEAYLAMAEVLRKMKRNEEAEEHIYTVLQDEPRHLAARVALAEHFKFIGNYEKAIVLYEKMIQEFPKIGGVRVNYALCLQELGRYDESEKHYMIAFEDQPDSFESLSNYLMGIHYNPERTKEEIFEAHKLWDNHFAPKEKPERPVPFDRSPHKKLRLGFISGGFRTHPVGWMITKALENLPDDQFEVYCYSTNNKYDQITRRIHEATDKWQSVIGYNDQIIARMIRDDEIDILVELSGHSADTRLRTVALEPAPVIVKWVGGLFNTTGLNSVDYLLTDHHETPKGEEKFYTEKLVRMPDDYICYMPPEYAPKVAELPANKNGHITFGCFNNPSKVNDQILEKWAGIMARVPKSRLFLKSKQYDTEALRERITRKMEECGIDSIRLRFEGLSPHDELLDKYNEIDIALDPWPYSGGLTTCEALYMGVPVVSKPGPTFAGRHSTTHLINAGLPELVVDTWDQYADKIVELATDLKALSKLRSGLRTKVESSPLTDGKRFGAHFAKALRAVWNQWVEGFEHGKDEWQNHIDVEPLKGEQIEHSVKQVELSEKVRGMLDHIESEIEYTASEEEKIIVDPVLTNGKTQVNGVHENGLAKTNGEVKKSEKIETETETDKEPAVYNIKTKDGVTICTPTDLNLLTPYVLLEQEQWYENEVYFVREYLTKGMNVVDAGAGFGVYALPAARLIGKNGHVYAFEPGEIAKHHLEVSKLENGFQNLEVIGKALSDKPGKRSWIEGETPELNRLYENGEKEVSAITLDSWWAFEGEPKIDLVKLDLNGHETAAIEKAKKVLTENSPVVLMAMGENREQASALADQFSELGYTLYEYLPGPGLLTPFEAGSGMDPYLQNLVALKPETIQELSGKGWIHDESYTPEEPEAGVWKDVIGEFPWAKNILAEWEKKILSPQNQTYLKALNYLCAAEIDDTVGKESRSRKGVWMLAAAQQLVQLYNSGENGTEVTFTLARVLNALGKRGQAVEVMQKLMETTKLGQENMEVKLPFLPPLPEQDQTEIKTEFKNWLTVRTVEAWISIKDLSTYLSGPREKKMLELLEGNVEVLDRIKQNIRYETKKDSDQEEKSTNFSNDSHIEKESVEKSSKIILTIPGRKGGAHGLHELRAKQTACHLKRQGVQSEIISLSDPQFVKKLAKAGKSQSVYTGIIGFDLWAESDMNISTNLYDLLDVNVFGVIADHPYTRFMWKRMERIPQKGVMISSTPSVIHEFKTIYQKKNSVKLLDRTPPTVSVQDEANSSRLKDRSIDILIPWGLNKFFFEKGTLKENLKPLGEDAVRLGEKTYQKALDDYEQSVFEIFMESSEEVLKKKIQFSKVKTKVDYGWMQVLSLVDWNVRKERRLRMLKDLAQTATDKRVIITADPRIAQVVPGLGDMDNIEWVNEVPVQKLTKMYLDSKIVLVCNPTFPDMVHERVRNAMACGASVISDYSPILQQHFGEEDAIIFTGSSGDELSNVLHTDINQLQQTAYNGYNVIKDKFSYEDYIQRLTAIINKHI